MAAYIKSGIYGAGYYGAKVGKALGRAAVRASEFVGRKVFGYSREAGKASSIGEDGGCNEFEYMDAEHIARYSNGLQQYFLVRDLRRAAAEGNLDPKALEGLFGGRGGGEKKEEKREERSGAGGRAEPVIINQYLAPQQVPAAGGAELMQLAAGMYQNMENISSAHKDEVLGIVNAHKDMMTNADIEETKRIRALLNTYQKVEDFGALAIDKMTKAYTGSIDKVTKLADSAYKLLRSYKADLQRKPEVKTSRDYSRGEKRETGGTYGKKSGAKKAYEGKKHAGARKERERPSAKKRPSGKKDDSRKESRSEESTSLKKTDYGIEAGRGMPGIINQNLLILDQSSNEYRETHENIKKRKPAGIR